MVKGTAMQNQNEKDARIRTSAYFRSLRRAPDNDPLMDWLEAEAEELAAEQDVIANESYLGPARSRLHTQTGITDADGKDHENPT